MKSAIVILLCLMALGALAVGIVAMVKGGGKENGQFQNKMMTYRIIFQAAAIGLMVLFFAAN